MPEPMTTREYQHFYDCGLMPERFWPEEIVRLRERFARGEITLQELDDLLDDMMRPLELRR
jgi:hypothetical protein